jgi:hypothetical protein
MPMAHRFATVALFSLAAGLLLTPAARPGDPLEEAKQRREVAIQQIEADVREAVREANQLAKTNPEAAIARLRQMLDAVEEDTALTPDRRATLKAMAKGRIRTLEAEVSRLAGRDVDDARASQRRADRRNDEAGRLTRGLQDVQALRSAGRTAEANQLQSDLARRYPDSAAATASRIISERGDRVTEGRRSRNDVGNGYNGALREVDKSAVPEGGDYVLPADWKTRIAKRGAGPKLTPEEKATLKALATPIKAELKDTPLSGVIDYLQQVSGVNIVADKRTLELAGASYETPITVNFRQATLRSVLKKVLADVNLTYIVKDAAIKVVTLEEAKTTMTVRSYYVGDLAGVVDVRVSPLFRDLQMQATIGQIIDTILGTIEPSSWESRGAQGGGTIAYDPITMSLIIKATAEVHYMLGGVGR